MPCHHCTREFSFFHREYGCPNCGFGHCSGCLKHKVLLPKTGREDKVCPRCYTTVTTPQSAPPRSPPKALHKRMERIEPSGLPRGLTAEDQRIADRLERLHQERRGEERTPTEEEVRQRLQKLKGTHTTTTSTPGTQASAPPRTATEQTSDLMSAVTAEVDLDSRRAPVLSPEADIAARLARLKGETEPSVTPSSKSDLPNPAHFLEGREGAAKEEEEEEDLDQVARLMVTVQQEAEREAKGALEQLRKDKAIQEQLARLRVKPADSTAGKDEKDEEIEDDSDLEDAVLRQILAEAKLEERLGAEELCGGVSPSVSSPPTAPEPEELPWCVICNEDAVVRCRGCGGDLYCAACYREFHVGEDPQEHSTTRFTK